ncbi:DUF2971 domain-containing protein [Asticcacaulis sp. SL142]|uniref:DUF2971 domain-containing protein n=1 Tax=Asticcacaulis sp. SL142 TaxID=2995155 RepID=UPI00226D1DDC|nr:DUF2971 domain-containing protein [Asticcacaulis sp. SL142]WAC49362.1 DUF2971 domain-containing protein [Asticcacaulis sp. SL142]
MTESTEKKVSEVYPSLFHYTTYNGLIGILQSQSLWATNYQFLNDSTEFKLAAERLVEEILPHYKKYLKDKILSDQRFAQFIESEGGTSKFMDEPSTLVQSMYIATGDEIYITSFSKHTDAPVAANGHLSQWRAYGADGGYAIEFNSNEIEILLHEQNSKFGFLPLLADMIYSGDVEKYASEMQKKS